MIESNQGNSRLKQSTSSSFYTTYPTDMLSPGKNYLSPFMLSYDAILYCNDENRLWSMENVKQYLYLHSINKEVVELVI